MSGRVANECAEGRLLNAVTEAMGGKLDYAIVPREEPVDGLRSHEEMIEDPASEMVREMPMDFWK